MTGKVPKGYFTILEFMTMNDFERRLAVQDFQRIFTNPIESVDEVASALVRPSVSKGRKATRKASKYGRALSQELKKINKTARTKSGRLRKGMTQGKILKKAHKAVKRRLK